MRRISCSVVLVCLVLAACAGAYGESVACTGLTRFQMPEFALTITSAKQVAAEASNPGSLPSYCRADGVLEPRVGVDGKHYGIGFAIALPDNWNGRFLFQGGGGLNGSVSDPIGKQAAGDASALARGFAVVSTDSGHKGAVFDASFLFDQEASLNFAYVAIGKVTAVAKAIVTAYYGKPAHHSYFDGCSTGGREAMMMTQRYPEYFDGVISGAPAMRTGFSGIGDKWVAVTLNQAAPKDASGKVAGPAFSVAERKLVVDGLLNACDAKDGVRDGMIFHVEACRFDPEELVCKGAKSDACLSAAQATALKKGFAGPKDSRGNQVYPGFFYDTGIGATEGIPGLLSWGATPFGPPPTETTMDVDASADAAWADPVAAVTRTQWTNLSTFSGHGGKVIFYHGVSDPWFSAQDTLGYYQRMVTDNGGAEAVSKWGRLYLVPGMGHCGGGKAALDSFDMVGAMVDWVEKGNAPDSVVATGKAFAGRSRPLCAYPMHAEYSGQGDSENAKNFKCVP